MDAGDGLLMLVYNLHLKSNIGALDKSIAKREETARQLVEHVRWLEAELRQRGRKDILLIVAGVRRWCGPVDLPADVIPHGVGVDAELDRFTGFGRIGFCLGIHRLSGWRLSPPSDNPMPSVSSPTEFFHP
jgi:hypothetical protein